MLLISHPGIVRYLARQRLSMLQAEKAVFISQSGDYVGLVIPLSHRSICLRTWVPRLCDLKPERPSPRYISCANVHTSK
jgi:hypothetical protein